ncbi:MAG: NAD-dependent epimerase/dehydratase family protein, partial [archaeon]|nr:NAD-dependent epimerase/dehydratase family protein [archaeon]
YPKNAKGYIKEDTQLSDSPDSAKLAYSWSKRFSEIYTTAFAKEHGIKIGIARPFNVYGPRVKTHVIATFIQDILENNKVKIIGDGQQERSFIYVTELARGLVKLAEIYPKPDPINFGTKEKVKITDLVEKIGKIIGKNPIIEYDTSSDPGSPMRICDGSKAEKILNFESEISLEEGIKNTVEWFKENPS